MYKHFKNKVLEIGTLTLTNIRLPLDIASGREIVIVENIRLIDSTADFGVKTNAKYTPILKLRENSKMVFKTVCTQLP